LFARGFFKKKIPLTQCDRCAQLTSQIRRLHDQLCSRSQISDGACRILDFIHRSGLLIMDEVDVILNPLRSELNFPIGAAESLPGYRWDLPIYLIDAIFYVERGELCEPLFQSKVDEQFPPNEVRFGLCPSVWDMVWMSLSFAGSCSNDSSMC
jgi:hypothetical protein